MATTTDRSITTTKTAVASAGDVTISVDRGVAGAVRWGIGEGTPPASAGHPLQVGKLVSMTLTGTEQLYLWSASDAATVAVTAAAPV